jgi:hypothetical protein
MKRIILAFILSFVSFGLIGAQSQSAPERKKTLVIVTINSGLPSSYGLDMDIHTLVAKKIQDLIKSLNQSSSWIEYDLLILMGDLSYDERLAAHLLSQPKIRDQIMETHEIIFMGLDHSNKSYDMIAEFLRVNPKIKVALTYSAGCFDLAKSKKWHEKTKTPYFIGHIGLSFSPLVYNSLIPDLLRDYADQGSFNETQLQNRISKANQEMAFNLKVYQTLIETISDGLMRILDNRPEYAQNGMIQNAKFSVDPNQKQIVIENLKEPLSPVERLENQTKAYLSTQEKPITPK